MRFVSLDAVEMRCVQNGNCSSDACLDILLLSSRRRLKWFEKKCFFTCHVNELVNRTVTDRSRFAVISVVV